MIGVIRKGFSKRDFGACATAKEDGKGFDDEILQEISQSGFDEFVVTPGYVNGISVGMQLSLGEFMGGLDAKYVVIMQRV